MDKQISRFLHSIQDCTSSEIVSVISLNDKVIGIPSCCAHLYNFLASVSIDISSCGRHNLSSRDPTTGPTYLSRRCSCLINDLLNNLLNNSHSCLFSRQEANENRVEKIHVLLDLLPVRSNEACKKLAECLIIGGQPLLADFLLDDDDRQTVSVINDLSKQLPFLNRNLSNLQRKQLDEILRDKIHSRILTQEWKDASKEKDGKLTVRQKQAEQNVIHEKEIKRKELEVLDLKKQLNLGKEEIASLKTEMQDMSEHMQQRQDDLWTKFSTQQRYSMANDSIAMRANERLRCAEDILNSIKDKLQSVVKLDERKSEKDLMKLAENQYHFLSDDVDNFIDLFKSMLLVQLKYGDLMDERQSLLSYMGQNTVDSTEQDNGYLLSIFKSIMDGKEQRIKILLEEGSHGNKLPEIPCNGITKNAEQNAMKNSASQTDVLSSLWNEIRELKDIMHQKDIAMIQKDQQIEKQSIQIFQLESQLRGKTTNCCEFSTGVSTFSYSDVDRFHNNNKTTDEHQATWQNRDNTSNVTSSVTSNLTPGVTLSHPNEHRLSSFSRRVDTAPCVNSVNIEAVVTSTTHDDTPLRDGTNLQPSAKQQISVFSTVKMQFTKSNVCQGQINGAKCAIKPYAVSTKNSFNKTLTSKSRYGDGALWRKHTHTRDSNVARRKSSGTEL